MKLLLLALYTITAAIPVSDPSTIEFNTDYKVVHGQLHPGPILVKYDMARNNCPRTTNTHRRVKLVYSINGQDNQEIRIDQPNEAIAQVVIPNVPTGDLAIKFVCTSFYSTTYDSDFGKSYHFNVTE